MKIKPILILIVWIVLSIGQVLFAQATGTSTTPPKKKTYSFEFALGIGRCNPQSMYLRSEGIDQLIGQYASFYNLTNTATGQFNESKILFPFSLSCRYSLKKKVFLQAGCDFSFDQLTSQKVYPLAWHNFNEQHDYTIKNKYSYMMPWFGAGYQFKHIAGYGALGIGFIRFSHDETIFYNEPGFNYEINETFKATSTAPGFLLGIQYDLPLPQKGITKSVHPFVKLEVVLLKAKTLKGSKNKTSTNSNGEHLSQNIEGTFYQYDWNPYTLNAIPYWDVFTATPSASAIYNPVKMSLNLSTIRLMVGISF